MSDHVLLHSAYGLGYDIRPSGKKADNCCLLADPLFVVCRAGPCPHIRLLATDDPSMCTSGRVSKYNSHRLYLLMLSSMHCFTLEQVQASLGIFPPVRNVEDSTGFSHLVLWCVPISSIL